MDPLSRRSSVSSTWEMVSLGTGTYTEERAPQFNPDNMSSGQVADASGDSVLAHPGTDLNNGPSCTGFVDDYHPSHKAPSNSSSTKTPATEKTMTLPHRPTAPPPAVDLFSSENALPHPPLSESNMKRYQHELEQSWAGNIEAWVNNTGLRFGGGRNNRISANNSNNNNDALSMNVERSLATAPAAGGERFVPGCGFDDWVLVMAPSKFDEDVLGTGMWLNDMPMLPVVGSRRGSLASSTISLVC